MRRTGIYEIGLLFILSARLLGTIQARQEQNDEGNKELSTMDSHEWRSVKDIKEKGLRHPIAVLPF